MGKEKGKKRANDDGRKSEAEEERGKGGLKFALSTSQNPESPEKQACGHTSGTIFITVVDIGRAILIVSETTPGLGKVKQTY